VVWGVDGVSDLQGDILVAERTDPGWVFLFPSASGILVERGSPLSHSAIVAREMGKPIVVNLPGLTARLHTGDEVEMDGGQGVVRILNS
jgi:pyruvate,water dikinase